MDETGPVGEGTGTPVVGTAESRAADEIVARLERIPFTRFHLRLASLLGSGTFFDGFDSLTIAIALTVIFTQFHVSFVNAGLLISAAYVGQFVGALAFGYLSEVSGRKPAFVYSLAIFGAFSLGTAVAWNFESLLIFRLLQGIGLGAEVPVAAALFNEYVRGRSRGKVFQFYESLFAWGLFLCPLVGLALFAGFGHALGWRLLFAVGALPLIAAALAHARLPESARWLAEKGRGAEADRLVSAVEAEAQRGGRQLEAPRVRHRADTKPTRFGELFAGIYGRRTVMCWTMWFCTYFVLYGYTVWLPSLYVRLGHLPPDRSVALSVVTSLAALAEQYVIAYLVDSWGRKPLAITGFALAAAGAAVGWILVVGLHSTGWPVLLTVSLIMLIGCNINSGLVFVYTAEIYPTRMRSWATSFGSAWNRIGSAIAPAVVGALLGSQLGLQSVFIVFLGVSLAGLVVLWALGIETKQRALEEISA